MLEERDHWAEELRKQVELHHSDTKKFLRDPDNDDNLVRAIRSSYISGLMAQNKKRERRAISDDEDQEDRRGRKANRRETESSERPRTRRREETPQRGNKGRFGRRDVTPQREDKSAFSQTPRRSFRGKNRSRSGSEQAMTPRRDTRGQSSNIIRGGTSSVLKSDAVKKFSPGERMSKKDEDGQGQKLMKIDDQQKNQMKVIADMDWPIEEFNSFLSGATEKLQEAQMAAIESKQFRQLIDQIPMEVREIYKLPVSGASYALAQTQAKKTIKQIETMVTDVKAAFKDFDQDGDGYILTRSSGISPK